MHSINIFIIRERIYYIKCVYVYRTAVVTSYILFMPRTNKGGWDGWGILHESERKERHRGFLLESLDVRDCLGKKGRMLPNGF